jgi:hypothetical protein
MKLEISLLSIDVKKLKELKKTVADVARQSPQHTPALTLARKELERVYAFGAQAMAARFHAHSSLPKHVIDQETRIVQYRSTLTFLGCSTAEIDNIMYLCRQCSSRSLYKTAFDYVDFAITCLQSHETIDDVCYNLYQTCMSNRSDEMKTDIPDEQFFK